MDKFWKWMAEEEYGWENSNGNHVIWMKNQDGQNQNAGFPTKQMLIGYMIEYLIKKGISLESAQVDIELYYNYLKQQIETIK